jgi:hypothetical protein
MTAPSSSRPVPRGSGGSELLHRDLWIRCVSRSRTLPGHAGVKGSQVHILSSRRSRRAVPLDGEPPVSL